MRSQRAHPTCNNWGPEVPEARPVSSNQNPSAESSFSYSIALVRKEETAGKLGDHWSSAQDQLTDSSTKMVIKV